MKTKILFLVLSLGFLGACTTAPVAREMRFDLEWIRTTLAKENYGYRHPERTAPIMDEHRIYQGNGIDGLVAMDRDTGIVAWRFLVKNGIESGLVLDDERIYFGASDGQFYAVSKNDGKPVWTFPTRCENLGKSLVQDGVVYFVSGNNVLYALDAKSGKLLWQYNRGEVSSLSIRGAATPVLYKNVLYAGFCDGYLTAINPKDGSLIWERKLTTNMKFMDVDATPVVEDDTIWVSSFDGALFALTRSDGQVQWRLDDGGAVGATLSGDTLYYGSLNQGVYALNKKTGAQKWKFSYDERHGVPTQPVLYKGLVIFGVSDGNLIALNEQTGKLVAQYSPGTGVFATPLIDPQTNRVYVFSNQANLHLVKLGWHRPQDDFEWK